MIKTLNFKHIKLLCMTFIFNAYVQADHFLSFVMPCYNCAQTVRESIDSIYQQDLTIPFEVICTDDGSTDETLSVLRECEAQHSNLHVIVHEKNLGGGAANNTCVANSKGDLLFRLDSDNVLAPNSVMGLVNLIDLTGCDGAAFQEKRFFHRGPYNEKVHRQSWFYEPKNNICDLKHALSCRENPLHSGNYLYTRKSFDRAGGYPMERSGTDTHSFGLKQYMTGSKIAILPNTFYWHLDNQNGYFMRESKTDRNRKVLWATFKKFEELFDKKTRVFLKRPDLIQFDPWELAFSGKISLIPTQALESLIKAYRYEEAGDIEEAIKSYKDAIEYGCTSSKIKAKLNNYLEND